MSYLSCLLENIDLATAAVYSALYLLLFFFYFLVFHTENKNYGYYRDFVWYQPIKFWWAKHAVRNYQTKYSKLLSKETAEEIEKPHKLTPFKQSDSQTFYGIDNNNSFFYLKLIFKENRIIETCLYIRLKDGTVYQLPEHPSVLFTSIPQRQWTSKGLTLDVVQPFKVLQITYNGLLRNCTRVDVPNFIEHVYFKFLWTYSSKPIYHPQDSDTDFLSKTVAREPWRDGNWIQFLGTEYGYKQFGTVLGQIKCPNSYKTPIYLHLNSFRTRLWGPPENDNVYRNITVFCIAENGYSFVIGVKSFKNGCHELHYGAVVFPSTKIYPIQSCDLTLAKFEDNFVRRSFKFTFTANHKTFSCTAFTNEVIIKFENEEIEGWNCQLVKTKYMLNGYEATGTVAFWKNHEGPGVKMPSYVIRPGEVNIDDRVLLVAGLSDKECKSLSLAGDKAVSMSLLTAINTKLFSVPSGFCVLVPALKHHIDENQRLKTAVDHLNNCTNTTDVQLACENFHELISEEPLSDALESSVRMELDKLRAAGGDDVKFVVTPSYVEHSEYLSANRHAKHFFGIETDDEVISGIKKCWASQFVYENVSLKREYSKFSYDMSVVVRLLIPSEISGNLFTNHPCNADPSRMLITANYGLMQGSKLTMKEADDIVLKRSWLDQLSLETTRIGSKPKLRKPQGSDLAKSVARGRRSTLCLTAEQIMTLGDIGVLIEKSFGKPCLIKWTFSNGTFYILSVIQSTNLNHYSSFIISRDNLAGMRDHVPVIQNVNDQNAVRLPGRSVNRRIVLGRACVVTSLRDVKSLKTGDILITTNLDVSYSTIFPHLHGIVTELDGLFSFGCTISREFDIPCLVNCQNATKKFKTGDIVMLNGKHGFLEKVG